MSSNKQAPGALPDSVYYPRYVAWCRDPAYIRMKRKHGHEGAGILSELLDYLREQDQYRAAVDDLGEIAFQLHADEAILFDIVSTSGLFQIDGGFFFSPWLDTAMRPLDEKRRKMSEGGRLGASKRHGIEATPQGSDSPPITTPSLPQEDPEATPQGSDSQVLTRREEYSIVENSKEEKNNISDFEIFWEGYGKKEDKLSTEKAWRRLSSAEITKVMSHFPEYIKSTPDLTFRKNPATYLNKKSFNNEIVASTKPEQKRSALQALIGGREDANFSMSGG